MSQHRLHQPWNELTAHKTDHSKKERGIAAGLVGDLGPAEEVAGDMGPAEVAGDTGPAEAMAACN